MSIYQQDCLLHNTDKNALSQHLTRQDTGHFQALVVLWDVAKFLDIIGSVQIR